MKVLVAVASKYGATSEIAKEIGEALGKRGLEVTVAPIDQVTTVQDYDAVVAGSAVYTGHWLKSAREFVEANAHALAARPTWLFSSGPIGDPPKPNEDPVDAAPMLEATAARGHRFFAGKLERRQLSFGERALVTALRAPEGDFRDWDEIRAWASEIADALRVETSA